MCYRDRHPMPMLFVPLDGPAVDITRADASLHEQCFDCGENIGVPDAASTEDASRAVERHGEAA